MGSGNLVASENLTVGIERGPPGNLDENLEDSSGRPDGVRFVALDVLGGRASDGSQRKEEDKLLLGFCQCRYGTSEDLFLPLIETFVLVRNPQMLGN